MTPRVFWIGLVIALLGGNALAMGVLIAKSGDPSSRVMPDYYQRAVAWDDTVAALQASDELGWTVESRLIATAPGRARLIVTIRDVAGAPVGGAGVDAEVRHRSRGEGVALALVERDRGRYEADLAAPGIGLHVVGVRARSGNDHYTGQATVELEGGP